MTVIVGVLCEDGVVVGSDSSATFSVVPGLNTIEQPATKTFRIGDDLVFAGTGQVGLGQRFHDLLSRLKVNKKTLFSGKHLDAAKEIAKEAVNDFSYTGASKAYGALVGFSSSTGPQLYEFSAADFQPEQKTKEMWFCSMGSGQPITDPFLAFIKRTMFGRAIPKLNEGVFMVLWALGHAIELNTGGIKGPPQIATLSKTPAGKYEAKILTQDDFAEHQNNIDGAELHLSEYRSKLTGKPTSQATTVTPPPEPPKQP